MKTLKGLIVLSFVLFFCSDGEKKSEVPKREILFLYTDINNKDDTQVYIMDEAGKDMRMVTPGVKDYFFASWSKTKKYLAFVCAKGSVVPTSSPKNEHDMIHLTNENEEIVDSILLLPAEKNLFHWGVDDETFFYTIGTGGANTMMEWFRVEKERWFDYRKGKLFYYLSGNDTIRPEIIGASISGEVVLAAVYSPSYHLYEMNYQGEILSEIHDFTSRISKACYFDNDSKIAFERYRLDGGTGDNDIYIYDLNGKYWSSKTVPLPEGFEMTGYCLKPEGEEAFISAVKREDWRTFPEESIILKLDLNSLEYEEILRRDNSYFCVQECR